MRPIQHSAESWQLPEGFPLERRVRALATRLADGQFISHVTAAAIWGMPLPTLGTGEPMHVSVMSPQPRPRANGLNGHELDGRVTGVTNVDGMRVSDPQSTWCQLAGMLSLPDLVAAADYLVSSRGNDGPLVHYSLLNEAVEARKGHRGAGQLRDALDLVQLGSRNRVESVLRVLMHTASLPKPQLHLQIANEDGSLQTVVPIAFPDYQIGVDVLFEADRVNRSRTAELQRLAQLDELGWRMVVFSDADIHPSRQFELRQKLISLERLLMDNGWDVGPSAA